MIITFVAYSTKFPSGGVMGIYEFANAMTRRGHEVHLVHEPNMPMRGGWVRRPGDLSWARFEDRIQHHFIGSETGSPEEFTPEDRKQAIPEGFELSRTDRFTGYPAADFVFRFHEDLPAECGLPLIFVQGNGIGTASQRRRMRAPCPKVCVASWLVAAGRRDSVPTEQLVYVPNGIDREKYRISMPIESRPVQVAMLYNHHPKKGSPYGLDAIGEVARRVPEMRAVVFGVRDPEHPLPACVEYRRNPPQTLLVHEVYNGSRVFVQPSLQEGFGFTSLEAMMCGCALVTTANGGSDDYAFHDETALVTQPKDVAAMADAIESLLLDDDRRVRLARRGTEQARTFDWDASATKLEAFLLAYASNAHHYRQPPDG